MLFTPREYQRLMISFMLDHRRCNIFAGMGLGKTGSSLEAFSQMLLFGEARRALVIAPKRVAKSSWPDEIEKWRESFGHLKIGVAIGTPDDRLAAVRSKPDILFINYDNIEWLIEGYGDNWPFDVVFADEATRIKSLRIGLKVSKKGNEFHSGQGSVRAKALSTVAFKKVRRWINLTGSPAPNGIQDLWGIQWFIDGGQRLGTSFKAFSDRWFRTRTTDYGSTLEPFAFSQGQIENLMRDCSITIDAKDWFDIKDPIERNITINLPPKVRREYERMEKELFAELAAMQAEGTFDILAFNSGSKVQKCLQIANGAVFHDSKTREWVEVHDEKIEALRSVLEEANGESVLIRYTHVPDRERILKAVPRARFLDDDPKTVKAFQEGKLPYLVTHARSAGHGLSLQDNCRILCDFSQDYNLEEDEQIIERIGPTRQAQSGHDRAVFRYRLVAKDTIEEHSVIPRLLEKISVQESFKRAMKIRG